MTEAEWEHEVWLAYLFADVPDLPHESGRVFCTYSPAARDYLCPLEQWLADHLPEACE